MLWLLIGLAVLAVCILVVTFRGERSFAQPVAAAPKPRPVPAVPVRQPLPEPKPLTVPGSVVEVQPAEPAAPTTPAPPGRVPVLAEVRRLLRAPPSAAAAFVLGEILGPPRCQGGPQKETLR